MHMAMKKEHKPVLAENISSATQLLYVYCRCMRYRFCLDDNFDAIKINYLHDRYAMHVSCMFYPLLCCFTFLICSDFFVFDNVGSPYIIPRAIFPNGG